MSPNYSQLLRVGFLVSCLVLSLLPVATGLMLWNSDRGKETVKRSENNLSQQLSSNSESIAGWSASSFVEGRGIVIDNTGNIYTLTFDFHLVKWNTSGNMLWDKRWDANISGIFEYGKDICIDSDENIYTVGTIGRDFEDAEAIVLVKWNTTGHQLWDQSWSINPNTEETEFQFYSFSTAIDTDGDVYTLTFAESVESKSSYVLTKWSTSGNQLWNRTWTAPHSFLNLVPSKPDLAISTNGNICTITGRTLIKWDTTGAQVWNHTFEEDPGPLDGIGAAFDDIENIYIVGHGYNRPQIMRSVPDILLMGCDANGTLLWRKTWSGPKWTRSITGLTGTSGISWAKEMVLDDEGFIYVVGTVLISEENWDILLMKWDTSGMFYGIKNWGLTTDDGGHNLALGKDKNIYCVGGMEDVLAIVVFSPDNFRIPEPAVVVPSFEFPLSILTVSLLGLLIRRKNQKSKF
ncbi:MAG: hypothetical protein ACFFBD_11625 [Candidatus Hodarchaeota archaeon]